MGDRICANCQHYEPIGNIGKCKQIGKKMVVSAEREGDRKRINRGIVQTITYFPDRDFGCNLFEEIAWLKDHAKS